MSLNIEQNLNGSMETLLSIKNSSTIELKLNQLQLKGLFMISKTLVLLLCLSMSSLAFAAKKDGAGSGGGGYRYIDTSFVHIQEAQAWLLNRLSNMTKKDMDSVTEKLGLGSVDITKLKEGISSLEFAPLDNATAKVNGRLYPKDMDYDLDNNRIIALQPLFEGIDRQYLDGVEIATLARKILHESSHLLGIGIVNDRESYTFSTELYYKLLMTNIYCGGRSSIDERVKSCESIRQDSDAPGKLVFAGMINFEEKKIYDLRSKINGLFTYTDYGYYSEDKNVDPEALCNTNNTFGDTVSWRPLTSEELGKVDIKWNMNQDIVFLKNNKVQIYNSPFVGRRKKIVIGISELKDMRTALNKNYAVACVGEIIP